MLRYADKHVLRDLGRCGIYELAVLMWLLLLRGFVILIGSGALPFAATRESSPLLATVRPASSLATTKAARGGTLVPFGARDKESKQETGQALDK